jgi:hypothetical protein
MNFDKMPFDVAAFDAVRIAAGSPSRALGCGPSFPRRRGLRQPEVCKFLEAEGVGYAIRLPANRMLHDKIDHLLKSPMGRPPREVRRDYSSFS